VRRKTWASVGALLVVALVGVGYFNFRPPPGDQGLSNRIAAEARRGPGTTIDVEKLAPFHWTDLYVFPPYTSEESAERRINKTWRYRWSAVEYRDDRAFLVFLDSGRVVAAFDHFRNRGDFSYYGHSPRISHLSPSEAKFVVKPELVLELKH
jgi:hypothetical protein